MNTANNRRDNSCCQFLSTDFMPIVIDSTVTTLAASQAGAITSIIIRDRGSNLPASDTIYAEIIGDGANGRVRMTIDPKCKHLIKDLEQVQRDRNGGIDKSNIELTHSLDAASYLIEYKWPIVQRVATSIQW